MKKTNYALGWTFAIGLFWIIYSKGVNKAELWIGIMLVAIASIGAIVQLWKAFRDG